MSDPLRQPRRDEHTATILAARYAHGDRVMCVALVAHTALALVLATFYSTWEMTLPVAASGLLTFLASAYLLPGSFLTRCIAGVSLQTFCALHIYQLHGLAEMHFFFFTGFTLMIVYGDRYAMWPGTILIIAQHIVFAVLTNAGIDMAFFPEAYVSVTKLTFHFGIAVVHVVICSYFAHLQRRHTLEEADRRRDVADLAAVAEQANLSKSTFLAHMSHEIRTPLTAILGYAELVREQQAPGSESEQMVTTVLRNGDHLMSVVDDILDLSKIEAGRLDVECVPCSPRQIVTDVVELLRARAAQKGVRVEVSGLDAVPDAIATDPTRLRQVLLNLGGNAVKFTAHGSVTFEVQWSAPDASAGTPIGAKLTVAVVDTGIGLDAASAARLFQPFRQADASTNRRFGGTGLGLVISRGLARLLGGDVVLAASSPQGCRFVLTIAADRPALAPGAPHAAQPAGSTASLTGRVLLVDDAEDNRRLLGHVLRRAGAAVETAADGNAALLAVAAAQASGAAFDLVLMDMQMPVLDGFGATRELRGRGVATPIVAVTANAMSGDRQRCLAAGCDDYLTKPIDRGALLATCEKWLAASRRSAPG